MFLAFPTIGPIESHPFTITGLPKPVSVAKEGATDETSTELEMVWIVRARRGLTARLKEYILLKNRSKTGDGAEWNPNVTLTASLPVFMDGPYGAPADIRPFETCVFIAGTFL